ncbi:NEAT domain-containing protein [Ammoniphilus oxalaticus]|nr:NEAT domain-containing protein [Ammoniphilus oxalaticus]
MKTKKVTSIMLLAVLLFTTMIPTFPSISAIEPDLRDGEYTIDFTFLKDQTEEASVVNDYVYQPANLVVENGQIAVEMDLKDQGWIQSFEVKNKQGFAAAEIIREDRDALRFYVDDLTKKLNVRTQVRVTGIPGFEYDNTYNAQIEWNLDRLTEVNVSDPEATEPEEEDEESEEPNVYEDGEYTIPFRALHATKEAESSMKDWLVNPAKLVVKDGKNEVYITVQEKPGQYLTDIRLENNGKMDSQDIISVDEASLRRVIKFEVPKLGTINAEVDMFVEKANYRNTQSFRVAFDTDGTEPSEDPTEPEQPTGEQVDVTVWKDRTNERSSLDSNIKKPVYSEVKDGKNYITLTLTDSSSVKGFKTEQANGEFVEARVLSEDVEENTKVIQFVVPDLTKKVNAKLHVYIPAIDYDNEYTVQLEFNTSGKPEEPIEPEDPKDPGVKPGNPGTNPGSGGGGGPVGAKRSSINLTILQAGSGDVSVMNGYVQNPATLIEEKGKNYIELTLKSSNWIQAFKTQQSGGYVDATVVSNDGDRRVVRFEVEDLSKKLNATTRVYIPASEFPGGVAYDNEYSVQIEFNRLETNSPTPPGAGGMIDSKAKISGSSGGKFEADGLTITFPAGSFSGDFNVTAKKVSDVDQLALPKNMSYVSDVLEIEKDQMGDFTKPMTMTFAFDPNKVNDQAQRLGIYWLNEETKEWIKLDQIKVDLKKGEISGEIDHFTKFAVLAVDASKEEVELEVEAEEEEEIFFTDVNGHWAKQSIYTLAEQGALKGYPDGRFKPNYSITRAEFTTALVKAMGLDVIQGTKFIDTKDHWANDYIMTAEVHGIVNGYNENYFGPNDSVTREQMAQMIVWAKQIKSTEGHAISFQDAHQIASWAHDAVNKVVAEGIMSGYPNQTFQPKGQATRAEAATVIVKALH